MHLFKALVFGSLALTAALGASLPTHDPKQVMLGLSDGYQKSIRSSLGSGKCNQSTIARRPEWDSMSEPQRLAYIDAVKCLQSKAPSQENTFARSRYDEFLLAHIDQTLKIHLSGLLLPWHRYHVWLYERALRDECGYEGYQPYWDWSKYVEDPHNTTIFDGSASSLSGNGKYVAHNAINITIPGGPPPAQYFLRPAGTGSGCVVGGPFENYTLLADAGNQGATTRIEVTKNPRCLTRDFYLPMLATQNSYQNVTDLILNNADISTFNPALAAANGVHAGGHRFIGGENLNLFTSPSDPAFYLHHAMVDRVWAIWQSRDTQNRQQAVSETLTMENYPPSPNTTVEDVLDVGILGAEVRLKQIMSSVDDLLCYMYV